jgi:uncharacterized protein
MEQIVCFIRNIICFSIKTYQYLLSPLIQPCCRFYPTCSQYALEALAVHGIMKGLYLAFCRLLRCHPWAKGGYDPVLKSD